MGLLATHQVRVQRHQEKLGDGVFDLVAGELPEADHGGGGEQVGEGGRGVAFGEQSEVEHR